MSDGICAVCEKPSGENIYYCDKCYIDYLTEQLRYETNRERYTGDLLACEWEGVGAAIFTIRVEGIDSIRGGKWILYREDEELQ